MTALRHGLWALALLLGVGMAGYAVAQILLGSELYPEPLRASFEARPWGIVPHAACGAIALLIAPWQFQPALYRRRRRLHRALGWTFLAAAFGTGTAGLAMSFFAYSGGWASAGFAGMALATLVCPMAGLMAARKRDWNRHRAWMLRAAAMIFAAVTFRLWLPALSSLSGGFDRAYPWTAWLSWIPNLAWAQVWLRWFPSPR